jgi:hypothetical protein
MNAEYVDLIVRATGQMEVRMPAEQILGRLAKTKFVTNVREGDEINLPMPAEITLFDFAGGDLPAAEYPSNSSIKIRVKRRKAINYSIEKARVLEINAMANDTALPFLKEYAKNSDEQFISAIETDYAALYTKAGMNYNAYVNSPNTPITITKDTAFDFFAEAAALFQEGKVTKGGVIRPYWVPGKMIMFIPPKMQAAIIASTRYQYTPEGFRLQQKGYIGELCGWSVFTSNYLAKSGSGVDTVYNPMFGIEGEALGGIIQKQMTITHYVPSNRLDDSFKGDGLYGTDIMRSDKLGTAAIKISAS